MPELILLATTLSLLSLTAMGLMTFLFIRLTANQTELIGLLTQSNQSLLNQARTNEIGSLVGLNQLTGVEPVVESEYISTTDREMAAWSARLGHGVGDEIYEEDLELMRGEM